MGGEGGGKFRHLEQQLKKKDQIKGVNGDEKAEHRAFLG